MANWNMTTGRFAIGAFMLSDQNWLLSAVNSSGAVSPLMRAIASRIPVRMPVRAARAGMITGVLLAVARISGETAPLLFTALNNQFWSLDLNAPVASLPVVIFQFALSPYADWQKLAWTGALIITITVLALSITARALAATGKQS